MKRTKKSSDMERFNEGRKNAVNGASDLVVYWNLKEFQEVEPLIQRFILEDIEHALEALQRMVPIVKEAMGSQKVNATIKRPWESTDYDGTPI